MRPHNYVTDTLVILDLDGTIISCEDRVNEYLERPRPLEKDYEGFYGLSMTTLDYLLTSNARTILALLRGLVSEQSSGVVSLAIVTGRPDRTRMLTNMWLKFYFEELWNEFLTCPENAKFKYLGMFMRPDHCVDKAPKLKKKLIHGVFTAYKEYREDFDNNINRRDNYLVIDDDPKCIFEIEEAIKSCHFDMTGNDIFEDYITSFCVNGNLLEKATGYSNGCEHCTSSLEAPASGTTPQCHL